MRIAVHYPDGNVEHGFATRWIEALKESNVEVVPLDFLNTNIISQVRGCDGAMWHWYHFSPVDRQAAPRILTAIGTVLDIPVFPNHATGWHYDDKVAQHYMFDAVEAPKIPSWVFWRREDALDFINKCKYPIVCKLAIGAGSQNVLKLDSMAEARHIVDRLFGPGIIPYTMNESKHHVIPKSGHDLKTLATRIGQGMRHIVYAESSLNPECPFIQREYILFQEYMPGNDHDIRILVIGDRAFGFIRYNREGDFRASGSGKLDFDPEKVPLEAVQAALDTYKKNDFQSVAYDFLRSPDGRYMIGEVSYCFADTAVYSCPGHWNGKLEWREGQMWPQEAIVEDFIEYVKAHKENRHAG